MQFCGQHTAENVTHHYHETVDQYISAGKVSNIIRETSNMLKTFRLPGFQDLKHTALQLQSSYGSESESHDEDAEEDVIESMLYLPEYDPCFGHSIQLVV